MVSKVFSRRRFLAGSGAAAAGSIAIATAQAQEPLAPVKNEASNLVSVSLNVNGQPRQAQIEPRVTLLDLLRERFGLTGTKVGCNHGQCGACTVIVDGRRVNSCMTLAAQANGTSVQTVEGLAQNGKLHPVQQAFIDQDAFQCGYCTPGQIMSAVACIGEGHAATDDQIREYMSGNLCRCAAYPKIVAAVRQAKTEMGA